MMMASDSGLYIIIQPGHLTAWSCSDEAGGLAVVWGLHQTAAAAGQQT